MTAKLSQLCAEFTGLLASSDPVPGGGGAAALCGALASALCSMAGELSLGKKSTAVYTDELLTLNTAAREKAQRFLGLIDADAAAFEPLSRAYSIPKAAPGREETLSQASITAASAPMDMLTECLETVAVLRRMVELCSPVMLSDVGCAASLCRAAAECAAMNVYVNLPGIADTATAKLLREKTDSMLEACTQRTEALARTVLTKLRG